MICSSCNFLSQQKLHLTLELNAQMQKELDEKEEKIRILEAKNETLRQTAEEKTDEIETLKHKVSMLEQEVWLHFFSKWNCVLYVLQYTVIK